MAVASAGPYASLHLIPDDRASIPSLSFLQARCPSCRPANSVKALKAPGLITNPSEIADTLASSISYNSSSSHYSSSFQKFKSQIESHDISFPPGNNELYNAPIFLHELKQAIFDSHVSTPGPDDVHYLLLKHLPSNSREALLYLFNYYWSNDLFPSSWHKAITIPIPKPDKDSTDPSNYRPIAFTCCLCKTFEHVVNTRKSLLSYLEINNISRTKGFLQKIEVLLITTSDLNTISERLLYETSILLQFFLI